MIDEETKITENIDNNSQLQSSKQIDDSRKKMKTKWLILLVVSLILTSAALVFIVILPVYKHIRSIFFGPSLSEYESYLAEKYEGDTFNYLSGNPSCPWFNTGYCDAFFSSTLSRDKVYMVVANRGGFSDRHYSLEEYYYNEYGGSILEEAISQLTPYIARATIINSNNAIKAYLMISSVDIDIYNSLNRVDFTSIESEVSKVIEQHNLKLASVSLVITYEKGEYTGVCPEEFNHTIQNSILDSLGTEDIEDDPDEQSMDSCLRIIYQKT